MSVEALNHAMSYVIGAWMLGSGVYLSIGFAWSLSRRIQADWVAASQSGRTKQTEDVEGKRLAEVSAVSKQYAKAAKAEAVAVSVGEG
ncbi:MAG: hypothetical protein AAF766_22495 [Cyanobacteria bacterium P01_D01_bin.14]